MYEDDDDVYELWERNAGRDLMYLAIFKSPEKNEWRSVKHVFPYPDNPYEPDEEPLTFFEWGWTRQQAREYFDAMYSHFHGIEPIVKINERYFEGPPESVDPAEED